MLIVQEKHDDVCKCDFISLKCFALHTPLLTVRLACSLEQNEIVFVLFSFSSLFFSFLLVVLSRQREKYSTSKQTEVACMEYFSVNNIVRGLGLVCESLFGVSLRQVPIDEWKGTEEDWVDEDTHAMQGARKIEAIHEQEGHIGRWCEVNVYFTLPHVFY